MNMLCCVPKAAIYDKQNPYLVYRRFKGGDDIYAIQNLADVSSFSLCVIKLLLFRIVESGYTLRNKFWLCCSFINSQLVTHKICSHFATRALMYLVNQFQNVTHKAFHIATKSTLNPDRKTTIGYYVITCS